MKKVLMPSDWPCKLSECRPGAFVTMDDPNLLCLKTEYDLRSAPEERTHELTAFNSAGEFFAAGADTVVWPVHIEEVDD